MLRTMRPLFAPLALALLLAPGCDGPIAVGDGGTDGSTASDCRTEGCETSFVCEDVGLDRHACVCPAGTEPIGDRCETSTRCTPDACSMRGACTETEAGVTCDCETPYAGVACETCAPGYFDDGAGGCSMDPCAALHCDPPLACVIAEGSASCACPAGTHLDAGVCVADTTCSATTCAHGDCDDSSGVLVCTCEAGFTGPHCDACDVSAGYHEDGAGGCTMDACLPSPCTAPHQSICSVDDMGLVVCACDAGYHQDVAGCVPDETCDGATCTNGTCAVTMGRAVCTCAPGWSGASCDACDVAAGYHGDGAGGCTLDACSPSPCTTPGRSVCVVESGLPVCECDAGTHDDGVGGCTSDPCRPSPCGPGEACRVTGGIADCYVPVCDDGNPCTIDTNVGGTCMHASAANGTSCSTSICRMGEVCTAGSCGGGASVSCDDGNPCTRDSCAAPAGCAHASDDTATPSDGLACTVDTCSGGAAFHAPSSAICNDSLFCSGTEVCAPGAGADARGCRTTPPTMPGGAPPCGAYVCDEGTDAFVLAPSPDGTSCDDGRACTTGDDCSAGVCGGTPTPACGMVGGCTPTSLGASLDIDIAPSRVTGRLLYGGSTTFPSSMTSTTASVWLRERGTGVHHYLESISFNTSGVLTTYGVTDDRMIDRQILPGTYDLVYRRFSSSGTYLSGTAEGDPYPYAEHLLRENVVISGSATTLDVDIAPTRVMGRLTYGGSTTFPNSTTSTTASVWLRERQTGVHHYLESISFNTSGVLTTYGATDDRMIDRRVLPGTYDLVYRRFSSSGTYLSGTAEADPYPYAEHVLRENVVVAGTTAMLDVDIAPSRVTGRLTYAGSTTFPDSMTSTTASVWLRERQTGVHHYLESISFNTSGVLTTYGATDDRMVDRQILPGTYDLVYRRFSSSGTYLSGTAETDPYPYAEHVLRESVVIAGGATTLDVDVTPTRVMGRLTYRGSTTFPDSMTSTTASVWLRERGTGVHHYLESISFNTSGVLTTYGATDDRTIDRRILPGTYDLVYRRFSSSGTYLSGTAEGDPYPYAEHVLRENVVVSGATAMLDVDIAPTQLTGRVSYGGSMTFPNSMTSTTASVWLRERGTGVHHYLESISFNTSGVLTTYGVTDDRTINRLILPGTYDVVYRRFSSSGTYLSGTAEGDPYPYAEHVMTEDVVISGASMPLAIDIAPVRVGGRLTYAGSTTFPNSMTSTTASVWLREASTGVHHYVESISFNTSGVLTTYGATDDRIVNRGLLPGAYDLVYRRFSSSGTYLSGTAEGDPYPYAEHVLRQCIVVED